MEKELRKLVAKLSNDLDAAYDSGGIQHEWWRVLMGKVNEIKVAALAEKPAERPAPTCNCEEWGCTGNCPVHSTWARWAREADERLLKLSVSSQEDELRQCLQVILTESGNIPTGGKGVNLGFLDRIGVHGDSSGKLTVKEATDAIRALADSPVSGGTKVSGATSAAKDGDAE